MKWCVCFPEEDILIKRPCLRRACLDNKTAAAFLSFLLYQVSISKEFKQNIENSHQLEDEEEEMLNQKTNIDVYKTQLEIVSELDHEISDRALRDTAIPLLVALGYIDVDESNKANRYTIHLARVQIGINDPPKIAEFLPQLHYLINDGSISDRYRNCFRRLAAILPTNTGNSSDTKNRASTAYKAERRPHLSKDKSKKSNKDTKKRLVVARNTTEIHEKAITNIAATVQPSSEIFLSDVPTETQSQQKTLIETPQPLSSDAPRTAKTVLHLIEFLRSQRFREPERSQQARAAAILIGIQPELSLKDIQNAWLHGSDEYGKKHHDPSGRTVMDLAHHNSHGKRRIIAALEHKQRQERESTYQRSGQDSRLHAERSFSVSATEPAWSGQTMTEQEAQRLAIQAIHDGQTHHYHLNAYSACEHTIWVVKVHLEQHIFTIHNPSEWSQEFAGIHEILQMRKKLSTTGKEDISCLK